MADASCIVIGLAATVVEAMRLIEEAQFDGASLDAKLVGETVDELAAILKRRNVPFAFVTGGAREDLPVSFRSSPMLLKPFTEKDLLAIDCSVMSSIRRFDRSPLEPHENLSRLCTRASAAAAFPREDGPPGERPNRQPRRLKCDNGHRLNRHERRQEQAEEDFQLPTNPG